MHAAFHYNPRVILFSSLIVTVQYLNLNKQSTRTNDSTAVLCVLCSKIQGFCISCKLRHRWLSDNHPESNSPGLGFAGSIYLLPKSAVNTHLWMWKGHFQPVDWWGRGQNCAHLQTSANKLVNKFTAKGLAPLPLFSQSPFQMGEHSPYSPC